VELDHTTELTLQALEESLWRPDTRFDARYMEAVLHTEFGEVGRSGRVYTREDTLGLAPVQIDVQLPLRGFYAMPIADDTVLVRYTSVPLADGRGAAHRASVWLRVGDRWRLRYHQATPTEL
jgi:ribonuclease HI